MAPLNIGQPRFLICVNLREAYTYQNRLIFKRGGAGLQNVHFWPVTKYLHLFLAPKVHKSQHILHHDKSALIATKVLKSRQKCANCRNVTTRLKV